MSNFKRTKGKALRFICFYIKEMGSQAIAMGDGLQVVSDSVSQWKTNDIIVPGSIR